MDARRTFDAARLRVTIEFPYLSQGVWALRGPILVPGLLLKAGGAIAVDAGWRVYLDPLLDWTVAQLATALRHEVWHCLREHAARRGHRCPQRWNHAGDVSINGDMSQERPTPDWPYEGLSPETFGFEHNLLEEQYYKLLQDQAKQPTPQCSASTKSCGGVGHGADKESEEGESAPSQNQGAAGSKGSEGSEGAMGVSPDCTQCGRCRGAGQSPGGSNSDGVPRVWEQASDGSLKEVTGAEADAVRRAVAKEVREYGSKSRGSIPAGVERWAEERLTPAKVPWQQVLRGAIRASIARRPGAVDYTRQRPSRRQAVSRSEVLLQSLVRPTPKVAVVIDTSGSMSDEQLRMAISEVQGVITGSSAESVAVLSCDSEAYDPQRVNNARAIQLKGGGGTDMDVGIAACKKLRPAPDVVVVITDGWTCWETAMPPRFRVVVCLVGQHADPDTVPKWARVVEVNE